MAEIRTLKDGTPPVVIGHFGSCARNIMVHHPPRHCKSASFYMTKAYKTTGYERIITERVY